MCVDARRNTVSDLPSFSLSSVLGSFHMRSKRPSFATDAYLAEIAIAKSSNDRNVFAILRIYDFMICFVWGVGFVNIIEICIISYCFVLYMRWAGRRFCITARGVILS